MEHKYKAEDCSILTPWYNKTVVIPMMHIVPWWLPANIITIMSNTCMFIAFILTMLVVSGVFHGWLLVPVLILAYITGDLMDGRQARRTKTCSPLGEFLDHFLDIFVNGMLLAMLLTVFEVTRPGTAIVFFIISYLTHAASYYEQYRTHILFFEKIGSFEALFMLTGFLTLGFIPPVKEFFNMEILYSISVLDAVLVFFSFATLFTMKRCFDRSGFVSRTFAFFSFLAVSAAGISILLFQTHFVMFIITAYCGIYIGRIQIANFFNQKEPFPDFVFPIFLAVSLIFRLPVPFISIVSVFYLVIGVILTFNFGFMHLKKHWLWVNPGPEFSDVYNT